MRICRGKVWVIWGGLSEPISRAEKRALKTYVSKSYFGYAG